MKWRHGFASLLLLVGQQPALAGEPYLVKDINPGDSASLPREFRVLGETLLFAASHATLGIELWTSDGTADGTSLVREIRSGFAGPFSIEDSIVIGDHLFFPATTPELGTELWRSEGTTEGTTLFLELNPGRNGVGFPNHGNPRIFTRIGDYVYFFAADSSHGDELWRTDGTLAGTTLFRDINPVGNSTVPNAIPEIAAFGDAIVVTADDGVSGYELVRTDGTDNGTRVIRDISFGGPLRRRELTVAGDYLFFVAEEPAFDEEVWRTDGTEAGTIRLKNINPSRSALPAYLTELNEYLYFVATDETGGALWRSDGTEAGTIIVARVRASRLFVFGGMLIFPGEDAEHGIELWGSDGTPEGTGFIKDINPGAASAFPTFDPGFREIDGKLFFTAVDDEHGAEVWVTDGTAAGTRLVVDIIPGPGSSSPIGFTRAGQLIFFSATASGLDRELWAVEAAGFGEPVSTTPTPRTSPAATTTPQVAPSATPTPRPCVGDCDDNRVVTIDELILGVNIALDLTPLQRCGVFDHDANGSVTVDEIVRGVGNAVEECP